MAFRNPVRRLSQLVADRVVGAILQTAETGNRVKIWNDAGLLGAFPGGRVDFLNDAPDIDDPATLWLDDPGTGIGPAYFTLYGANIAGMLARPFVQLKSQHGSKLSSITLRADQIITSLLTPSQLQLGNGSPFTAIDWGYTAGTTNGAGQVVVNHALGGTPQLVLALEAKSSSPWTAWNAKTSNTAADFTMQARRADTNAVAGAGVGLDFFWLVAR